MRARPVARAGDGSEVAPFGVAAVPQAQGRDGPCPAIGDYTDFYTGIHHATTVGQLFRPTTRCCPTTSGCPSATTGAPEVHRPPASAGPRPGNQAPGAEGRASAPAGAWTTSWSSAPSSGRATPWATRCDGRAEDALFGVTLLNDWSARDVQAGNTSRWGPFCPRALPPRSRPGSSRWRWRRSAFPSGARRRPAAAAASGRRPATKNATGSISPSRSSGRAMRAGRGASRAETRQTQRCGLGVAQMLAHQQRQPTWSAAWKTQAHQSGRTGDSLPLSVTVHRTATRWCHVRAERRHRSMLGFNDPQRATGATA